jgi:hypothetical protein
MKLHGIENFMKISSLLIYFFFSVIFFACGNEHTNNTGNTKAQAIETDPIKKNYWPVDKDTTITDTTLSMYNETYQLKIKTYCLNDSAVVNKVGVQDENGAGMHDELDISHNYSVIITLTKDSKEILSKQLTKEIFKDSLDAEFYKTAILNDIEYKFVRTNRLYFTATLLIPDTDIIYETDFAIFYRTDKIGQLDFWAKKN